MTNDTNNLFLRVAVTLPLSETYTYRVPPHLVPTAEVGRRVLVPFRNQKVTGYILEKGGVAGEDQEKDLKEILAVLDEEPLFHEGLVPFFAWMSDYYLHPIGRLIQASLPGGINMRRFKTGRLTEKGRTAADLLPAHSDEKKFLGWVQENPGKKLPYPLHTAYECQKKGWLIIESGTRSGQVGPLKRKFVKVKGGMDFEGFLKEQGRSFGAENELEFLETVFSTGTVQLNVLTKKFKNGDYLVGKWVKKGILERCLETVFRDPAGETISPAPLPSQLYPQQEEVLGVIRDRLERRKFSTCLLYGVTGSGKTEVYYNAIEHVTRMGGQAILMAPEIALSRYLEGIFKSRLNERVAMFHSGLSDGERYDQWMRMARGEVDLVIGARSALFAPFPRLGLIIVDEEHDASYKQEEAPRYQARDAAVVRGKMEHALVILGSGTPSVQSFHNADTGRYHLLSMPERIESRSLPNIHIVDMKTDPESEKNKGIISRPLKEALDQNLVEGKQAILFLNRRGFNRVYLCRFCGQSVRCPNCDLALIYHRQEHRLSCHFCGFHTPCRDTCPSCRREGMRLYGYGTERLEHELRERYPDRRIARLDRDSTRRKGHALKILRQFGRREVDILVGTQMITKGYDFPNVTLVGVIAADLSLGFPDFRAGERTFQILSQVAGRAGRGDQKGQVIVQTFNPEHYAITTAERHDYPSFFLQEKGLRQQLGYPPFSYLVSLRVQGNNQKTTAAMATRLGQEMTGLLRKWPKRGKEIQVLGPVEAPLTKLKGKYRWQILVKSKNAALLHYFLKEVQGLSRRILRSSGVGMMIDVDPYQML